MEEYPIELNTTGLLESLQGLQHIPDEYFNGGEDTESPVFIFSSGTRSGSTLTQRLLCSDRRLWLWGEPMGAMVPVARMAMMWRHFADFYRGENTAEKFGDRDITKEWVHSLNPGSKAFWLAHRAFFDSFLRHASPVARWGAKWVRLRAEHHAYLKWLYPKTKSVFMVRDPRECLRSYLGLPRDDGQVKVPREPIIHKNQFKEYTWRALDRGYMFDAVEKYVEHWRQIAESQIHMSLVFPQSTLLVRYEDLVGDPVVVCERISNFLGVRVNPSVVSGKKIGNSMFKKCLPDDDQQRVIAVAGKEMRYLKYV